MCIETLRKDDSEINCYTCNSKLTTGDKYSNIGDGLVVCIKCRETYKPRKHKFNEGDRVKVGVLPYFMDHFEQGYATCMYTYRSECGGSGALDHDEDWGLSFRDGSESAWYHASLLTKVTEEEYQNNEYINPGTEEPPPSVKAHREANYKAFAKALQPAFEAAQEAALEHVISCIEKTMEEE